MSAELASDVVADLIREVAAEIIDPHFGHLEASMVHEKGPGDLVTDLDRRAEQELSARLGKQGGGVVVGEEAVHADPRILDQVARAEHVWVLDPIDGTRNYVRGSADHAVMVAELREGVTVRSWIWQPQLAHMWAAERGAGLSCDGQPVRRGPCGEPVRAVTSHDQFRRDDDRQVTWGRSRYCCGVDYPLMLTGQVDATVYLHSHPWDHLPGALMIAELGGGVSDLDGSAHDLTAEGGPILVAVDDHARRAVVESLR